MSGVEKCGFCDLQTPWQASPLHGRHFSWPQTGVERKAFPLNRYLIYPNAQPDVRWDDSLFILSKNFSFFILLSSYNVEILFDWSKHFGTWKRGNFNNYNFVD